MGTLNKCTPAIRTTKSRWEGLQVQAAAPSDLPVRHLPIAKAVLTSNSKLQNPLAGICQTSRLSLQRAHPLHHRQFAARAATVDGGLPQSSPGVIIQNDDQPPPTVQSERKQNTEHENEPLGISEEDLYDEQDPQTPLPEAESKDEGIIIEDAHLMPLPANTVTDFERNQLGGRSESSCDDGSILYGKRSAAVDVSDMSTSGANSESFLIERLLESLPIYDSGRSAEDYRIRAQVYGWIADYFSEGEGKARRYGVRDNKQSGTKVRMLTAMQQLADFILSEEGRSAADYNCRAQFFQNSAEIFCVNDDKRAENSFGGSENGEQRMEKVLQQLGDVMLSDSGRSIADYNRRANVFGKTADVLCAGKSGAATIN